MSMPSGGGGAAYDISASSSTSSAANPVGQFGNITGGGRNTDWWMFLLAGVAGFVVIAFVWKKWIK